MKRNYKKKIDEPAEDVQTIPVSIADITVGKPYIQIDSMSEGLIGVCSSFSTKGVWLQKHKTDITYKVSVNDFKKHYELITSKEQIAKHYKPVVDGQRTDLQIIKVLLDSGRIIYWTGRGWEPDISKAAKMPYTLAELMVEDMYNGSSLRPMLKEHCELSIAKAIDFR